MQQPVGKAMLAIIATLKIKPGMAAEFEAEAKTLVAKVTAGEPGCALYTLCRAQAPHTYVMLERYVDQAALEFHRGTAHFKEVGAKLGTYLDGRVDVQVLTEV
jgi:quinol monooxygenase YgiN